MPPAALWRRGNAVQPRGSPAQHLHTPHAQHRLVALVIRNPRSELRRRLWQVSGKFLCIFNWEWDRGELDSQGLSVHTGPR